MKELSKRSVDYMNLYLNLNNMNYITINKHDFKILYNYNKGRYEIINNEEKTDKALKYIEKQKSKMYKSRNKIAMYILMKLEKILEGEE